MVSSETQPLVGPDRPTRPKWRVLIFPGGTEIGLELRHALGPCKEVELFSASAPVSNHAPFVFARHFAVPMVGAAGWLEALKELIAAQNITHIFPAHDDALLALAENAGAVPAKIVTSPVQTCRIARSKKATIQQFQTVLPTPEMFTDAATVREFPVFLKPDRGQGSWRTERVADAEELKTALRRDPDRIISEFLPGREYTIDCFSDRERGLLFAKGRERRRLRSGIAMDSIFVENSLFLEYADRIHRALALYGAWFYQLKEDRHGQLKLMEIAPRIGGTSALSRMLGVNLALLSLYEADRMPVSVSVGNYRIELDRALVNRYRSDLQYRTLYVDFDDTLILRGQVNAELVKLLCQALNKKARLVLLSRHAGDLRAALRNYRLEQLFDEIIHLRAKEPKANFITDKCSILIDDSFAERQAVHTQAGIPVFDTSMIEALFDERL